MRGASFCAVLVLALGSAALADPGADRWAHYQKPTDAELRARLEPLSYDVTQHAATEPPFENAYWHNEERGIYVDVVSGEPLFSSLDKYDSGTGWPSFTRPLEPANVETREDRGFLSTRTEVRSKHAGSHLGHLFDDGPPPTGKRYCMNSAALRFVPVAQLAAAGYGKYLAAFEATGRRETALLAGGCFWGMEELLRVLPGVIETRVGYTGGTTELPAYADVHAGRSGHAEAVEVVFDPARLSYAELLEFFFRIHDPTTLNRQGNDVGVSYRSAIFYETDEQRRVAEQVKQKVDASKKWPKPVVTQIAPAGPFWPAEEEHQDYLQKHPGGYTCHYVRDFDFV